MTRKRRGEGSPSREEDSPRADMKRLLDSMHDVQTQLSSLSAAVCTKEDLTALREEVRSDVAGVKSEVASVAARVAVLESRPLASGAASSADAGGSPLRAFRVGAPPRSGTGSGPSVAPPPDVPAPAFAPTRVDIKGLVRYERRMEESLTSEETDAFIRRVFGALSEASREALLPLDAQVRRNDRVLVSVPALFLKPDGAPAARQRCIDQLRALFDSGEYDHRGRRPWPQLQLRPEQRELSRRLALGWRLLERIKSAYGDRVAGVKSEAQGRLVYLWQLVPGGRPVSVGKIDEAGMLTPDPGFFIAGPDLLTLWRTVSA